MKSIVTIIATLVLATVGAVGGVAPQAMNDEQAGAVNVSSSAARRPSLAPDTIALGDQTVLTLAQADSYPSAQQLSQGGVLVLAQEYDTASAEMRTLITSFEPGEHWLHVAADDSLLLVVTDVDVDTANAEIRDIAPIERVPYTFWEVFRWVLLVLVLAAAGVAVWWLLSHRQRVQQVLGLAEAPDNRNPYERATDGLVALRDRKLWQAGKVKEYYTELTDIVRRFIEESTAVRATEMTSDETLEAVRPMADTAQLRDLFVLADLVKFAKREPLPHEHEGAMDKAAAFVDTLWQSVKPAAAEADKEAAPHDA